jgi:hypothetical protein
MALEVTNALRAQLESEVKSPQLILEIEGLPTFSSIPVGRYLRYGDLVEYGDAGLYYGGLVEDSDILAWIDLKKSTNQITQQIMPDKGGFSSITNFDVAIVDKDARVSEMILAGNLIDDILGAKAKLYLCFEGAGHPEDSILFFNGIVSGCPVGAGYVKFNLSSSEKLKNLEIFPKVSTTLTSGALSGDLTLNVESTADFLTPANGLRCYLIAGDEYIEYTAKTATTFTVVRAQYDTIAAAYSSGDNLESAYRLTGTMKDLALKIMLSGQNTSYYSGSILGINTYGIDSVSNAIFVDDYFFKRNTGAVAGDTLVISGASIAGNNITTEIVEIVQTESGVSYIIVNDTLTTEGTGATITLTSQFAVWPKFAGLEMDSSQVDVQEFLDKDAQFSTQLFQYDFFLKDAVKGSEFINEQILFPSGCYSIPRKAKTSLGITAPPISGALVKTVNEDNVTNASSLVIERSINNNFYNAVIYKYDKDEVTDKFQRGKIIQSSNSTNRIRVANKPLVIEAEGVKPTGFTDKVNILSNKALSRYQYGAESIEVRVSFGFGFEIEIGDVVLLQGEALQISDSKTGTRLFKPRLFEVQNKTMYLSGQPITLKLVDTAFNLNGRYGVYSPSSKVSTGSTTTVLNLQRSFGTNLGLGFEGDKYKPLIGALLRIRSEDHSFAEDRYLLRIDTTNKNGLVLSSALSTPPLEDYIVEVAPYSSSTDSAVEALTKTLYVSWDAQIPVDSGTDGFTFDIDAGDLSKVRVGATIYLHDADYTNLSAEVTIEDISGTTITVSDDLGFTPDSTMFVELNTFADDGEAYRWY